MSNLKGIVIDAGHGGTDSGAVNGSEMEKSYTLLMSLYMYKKFNDLGIPCELTRSVDETLSPSARVKKALSFYGNDKNILLISNHLNAGGGDSQSVTMFNN